MNPVAFTNQSPLILFVQSGMEESGVPREGSRDGAAITQFHN